MTDHTEGAQITLTPADQAFAVQRGLARHDAIALAHSSSDTPKHDPFGSLRVHAGIVSDGLRAAQFAMAANKMAEAIYMLTFLAKETGFNAERELNMLELSRLALVAESDENNINEALSCYGGEGPEYEQLASRYEKANKARRAEIKGESQPWSPF